jgi:hypothetical protein
MLVPFYACSAPAHSSLSEAKKARSIGTSKRSRVKHYKGSFSVLGTTGQVTAAKVVIFESGKGKINGTDPAFDNGIVRRMADGQRADLKVVTCPSGISPAK